MKKKLNIEAAVIDSVSGLDHEALGHLKLEIGMDYCHKYGIYSSYFWKEKDFWTWFGRIWEINDKRFLQELHKHKMDTVDIVYYEKFHRGNSIKWNMTGKIRDNISKKIIHNFKSIPYGK